MQWSACFQADDASGSANWGFCQLLLELFAYASHCGPWSLQISGFMRSEYDLLLLSRYFQYKAG